MATVSISVGGTSLPGAKVTGLKRNDELLWSEGTGRSASSGQMTGSIVAEKRTYSIEFGPLTASEYATVRGVAGKGHEFCAVSISVAGSSLENGSRSFYRSAVPGELMGVFGGVAYYGGVAVELVER